MMLLLLDGGCLDSSDNGGELDSELRVTIEDVENCAEGIEIVVRVVVDDGTEGTVVVSPSSFFSPNSRLSQSEIEEMPLSERAD